jgi:hypothetical protein
MQKAKSYHTKIHERNDGFWEAVRTALVYRAGLWSRGSEGRALIEIAQADDWQQVFKDYAPASPRLGPDDVAIVLIYRLMAERI